MFLIGFLVGQGLSTGSGSSYRRKAEAFYNRRIAGHPAALCFQIRVFVAQHPSRFHSPQPARRPCAGRGPVPLLVNPFFVHAPTSRGIPAFFHSPPASECLLFAWPKRRHQEKATPHSRLAHSPCAPGPRACYGVRRQSIHGLASNWPTSCGPSFGLVRQLLHALLSTACSRRGSTASIHECVPPASMQSPSQARRDRGGPDSAHRARQMQSQSRKLLRLGCAGEGCRATPEEPKGSGLMPPKGQQAIEPPRQPVGQVNVALHASRIKTREPRPMPSDPRDSRHQPLELRIPL